MANVFNSSKTPFLKSIIDDGSVVVYLDFRSGGFKDYSIKNRAGTVSVGNGWLTNGGYWVNGDLSGITFSYSTDFDFSAGVTCFFMGDFSPSIPVENSYLINFNGDAYFSAYWRTSNYLSVYGGGSVVSNSLSVFPSFSKSLSFTAYSSAIKIYVDGKLHYSTTGLTPSMPGSGSLGILRQSYTTSYGVFSFLHKAVLVVKKVFTDQEHAILLGELESIKWPK